MPSVAGRLWSRFPSDLPSRLRFALLAFAAILVATCVPFAIFNSAPIWSRCLLIALYAVVLIRWTAWFRGGYPAPADLAVELLALLATTVVTADPSNAASFLYAGVIIRAYFGSNRQLAWTLGLYNLTFLASVLIAPNTDHSLLAPNVLSQPPTAIVAAAVIAWFSRTVKQHHRLLAEQDLHVALQNDLLAEVRAGQRRFQSLVEALPGAILTSTPSGEVRYVSPQAGRIFGIAAEDLQTSWTALITRFVHPEDQARVFAATGTAIATGEPFSIAFRATMATGDLVWLQIDSVLVDDGSPDSPLWQSLLFDVTERHTLTEQLTHQAYHDTLTGLPNRRRFHERVDETLKRATRDGIVPAVCFIDLDNFKTVNDTLGHLIGDRLIVEAAKRLRRSVRDVDVVARLGGDEFALLLETPKGQADIIRVVERIVNDLSEPFPIDGQPIVTSASVGIAIADSPDLSRTELIRRADVAMYAAKDDGKARYAIFDPQMNRRTRDRLDLELELQHALARDELRFVYQPIVDLDTGTIRAVEALLRWQHPTRGLVSPDAFLSVLEDSGMIVPVGHQMLARACRQLSQWQQTIPGASDLSLSLNLSPRQIQDSSLVEAVSRALAETGVCPGHLQLEISEQTMLADVEHATQAIAELTALGNRIAIDDFGTGNASLGHLRQLPVQMLKVDRSYIEAYGQSEQTTTMLRAMVTLGKTLGMQVTAEGIETIEQTALRTLGCDFGQGFYFARPLRDTEVESLLTEQIIYPLAEGHPLLSAIPAGAMPHRQAG
ncbi:MAG TPA: EAL domain-containing protein [Thermomicrobiales bacterium]|nr:EAL domain-containing protein [Thermomicrobiales bacterium]